MTVDIRHDPDRFGPGAAHARRASTAGHAATVIACEGRQSSIHERKM
jgi:hypothetical protein